MRWTSTPLSHSRHAGSFGTDTLTVDGGTGGSLRMVR